MSLAWTGTDSQRDLPLPANVRRHYFPGTGGDIHGGNEAAGIPSVLHQAPPGTYTGWNATASGSFKGQPCGGGLNGGFIPFAKDRAERMAAGDPRLCLEERHGTQRGYLCKVKSAIAKQRRAEMRREQDAVRLPHEAAPASNLSWTAPPAAREP